MTNVLDSISGAIFALSFRKLNTNYTGACIRVRRDSDNQELDIEFLNKYIDKLVLLAFAGSSNGYITKWYDQSGNGNDAVQADVTKQPLIVSDGVINTSAKNIIASRFNNSGLVINYNNSAKINGQATYNAIINPKGTGGAGFGRIIDKNASNDYSFRLTGTTSFGVQSATPSSNAMANILNTADNFSITSVFNGSLQSCQVKHYLNGNMQGAGAISLMPNTVNKNICIGNRDNDYARGVDANISEMILFGKALSNKELRLLANSQRKYCKMSKSSKRDNLDLSVVDNWGVACGRSVILTQIPAIAAAGFKYVRTDLAWATIEYTKNVYDFRNIDNIVELCETNNIGIVFILNYNSALYASENLSAIKTKNNLEAFLRFTKQAITRYKGKKIIWEIWNEPNSNNFWRPKANATEYMALFHAAVDAIRAIDKDCMITAPTVSEIPLTFLNECFKSGLLDKIDAVSAHPYSYTTPEYFLSASQVPGLKNALNTFKPNEPFPWACSESGFSSVSTGGLAMSEEKHAKYIKRFFMLNTLLDSKYTIYYNWQNSGTDTTQREQNFGMIRADGTSKPALEAYKYLVSNLSGCRFIKRLDSATDDYILEFQQGVNRKIAAWTTATSHSISVYGNAITLTDDVVIY